MGDFFHLNPNSSGQGAAKVGLSWGSAEVNFQQHYKHDRIKNLTHQFSKKQCRKSPPNLSS